MSSEERRAKSEEVVRARDRAYPHRGRRRVDCDDARRQSARERSAAEY